MSTHKTMVSCGLESLGADPTKPSYLFASIYKANRPSDNVLPDYDGIMYDQQQASNLVRMMNYGLWAQTNWEPFFEFTTARDKLVYPIPIKANGTYYGDGSFMDSFSKYRNGLYKVLGMKPAKLIASIKGQSSNDIYQHMAIVFGVPANTQDKYMLSVLFDTLNHARINGITSLGFDADPGREQLYNCNLSRLPSYTRGDGVLPGHKKDDCWIEGGLTLTRQLENYWEQLSGFDISGGRDVHSWRGDNETKMMTWSQEMNKNSTGLFVPVTFDDIQTHQRMKKVTPLTNLAQILVTKVTVIKIPWYAQSWFKYILIVVMIIITIIVTVFTLGAGTPGIIAADSAVVGAIAGVVGAVVTNVVIASVLNVLLDYIISFVVEEVLKAALKPLVGKNLASLIAGIGGMIAGFAVGGFDFSNILSDAQALVNVAAKISNYVITDQMDELNKKMNAFQEEAHAEQQNINNHWETNGMQILSKDQLNPVINDPVAEFQLSQTDTICKAAVVTGYDIADIQMLQIKDHFKNGTSLNIG